MKAVAFRKHLPIDALDALIDIELTMPVAKGRDLLVEVKAISVNPVDVKVRRGKGTEPDEEPPRVIGWDASGIVTAVGSDVSLFKPGDAVYYAGDLTRSGCNAQFQLVDEHIVGHKPKSISHAEAAALPLTSITAYESLFDRLRIDRDGGNRGESVLIIGGAGGVGLHWHSTGKARGPQGDRDSVTT